MRTNDPHQEGGMSRLYCNNDWEHKREADRDFDRGGLLSKPPGGENMSEIELREATPHQWRMGFERYEKLRRLNPREFSALWEEALESGKHFDELVDELPGRSRR